MRLFPVLAAVLAVFAVAQPVHADEIAVSAHPVTTFHIGSSDPVVGRLRFVGGLELSAADKRFGGLSGLRLSGDGGRLYAVSDDANWFTAELVRDSAGRLSGLGPVSVGCLCRQDSTRYGSKHWGDSEGLEVDGDTAYVSFERLNRINRYDLGRDHLPGRPVQATASFKRLNIGYNKGLEAMALAPSKGGSAGSSIAGRFVAIAEESLNAAGNNRAFIADDRAIEEFAITRSDAYSPTDAAFLPDGDLLVLERRFGFAVGLGMRIRRFAVGDIRPGAVLSGEVLAEADLSSRIDNMEGIAAWRDGEGRTRIALVSDDNFNKRLQRTLLLEFVLDE
ncbi:MAG: esterase-like activity of phytase family protein [Nitratireductor sp.]|nr:esterase-like activity of phytase family protein [Nitratireductor sp.]